MLMNVVKKGVGRRVYGKTKSEFNFWSSSSAESDSKQTVYPSILQGQLMFGDRQYYGLVIIPLRQYKTPLK